MSSFFQIVSSMKNGRDLAQRFPHKKLHARIDRSWKKFGKRYSLKFLGYESRDRLIPRKSFDEIDG